MAKKTTPKITPELRQRLTGYAQSIGELATEIEDRLAGGKSAGYVVDLLSDIEQDLMAAQAIARLDPNL